MLILMVFSLLLLVLYIMLMLVYRKGWNSQETFFIPANYQPHTKISLIIPARNEVENIRQCIASILASDYPKELFEIIVIDDHSTDNTYEIVKKFEEKNVSCLKLQDYLQQDEILNAYKKRAIQIGVVQSSGSIIVTTDADCIVPVKWLKNIAALYERDKPVMIIGAVSFISNKKLISLFQSLDFMSMQGITAAAHKLKLGNMSNGANLAFDKNAFQKVKGYEGIDHLASGDDYLLMMKMQQQYPNGISYLKSSETIVTTASQPDWKSFLNQRIRWASKTGKYDDKKLTIILLFVYVFNFSFLILFIAGFFDYNFWILDLGMLLIKTVIELFYLLPVARFFKKEKELLYFPMLQTLHISYIILAGFLGFFGKYKWKGRSVR